MEESGVGRRDFVSPTVLPRVASWIVYPSSMVPPHQVQLPPGNLDYGSDLEPLSRNLAAVGVNEVDSWGGRCYRGSGGQGGQRGQKDRGLVLGDLYPRRDGAN